MDNRQLVRLREGEPLSTFQQVSLIASLSVPAILARLTTVVMQYIDASMVGRIGAEASAAIGLVSSSTWLIWGLCFACMTGFSVQVAQRIGAGEEPEAFSAVRHGLIVSVGSGIAAAVFCALISGKLPLWLGGNSEICGDASAYFLIYMAFMPVMILEVTAAGMLEASGNMQVPSILSILICVLDVIFNFFLIFPTRTAMIFGRPVVIPGAGMAVRGAALGTVLSELCGAVPMCVFMLKRFPVLKSYPEMMRYAESLKKKPGVKGAGDAETGSGSTPADPAEYPERAFNGMAAFREEMGKAVRIALPVGADQIAGNGAQVLFTRIVAPLGTIAIAAHTFSITAEGLCYMPGYGIGTAATTLIGQSTGAGRKDMTRRLAWLTVIIGTLVQALIGVLMYIFAPVMIGFLSPDPAIRELGAQVLRIEAVAEPLFGASIIGIGIFRGAGKTLIPSIINFVSMWAFRLPMALLLAARYGLRGVWTAMALELCVRGILYLVWLRKEYQPDEGLTRPEIRV